jgi:HAD superfamily hydrolase (TIGR01509 family)
VRLADLDAVTLDAYGTLLELRDPVETLRRALAARGVARDEAAVRAAFDEEVRFYAAHKLEARDDAGIERLYARCTETFLGALGVDLPGFDYAGALEYDLIDGAGDALRRLRAYGLALAVVADWDASLPRRLRRMGLASFFDTVVVAAEVGAEKPSPAGFRLALERLGVEPRRALHVGDQPRDAEGAAAAGVHFAPTPLRDAVERLA